MVTYYVGEGDRYRVDHPPIFACRKHRSLLTLSERFVEELLSLAQDVMPGNPDEICASFLKESAAAYKLPDFLLPPKVILFNPQNLRGAEALPYTLVLVDKRFFGVPARYLTPDRFDGCEECKHLKPRPRPRPAARPGPPPGARPRRPPPVGPGSGRFRAVKPPPRGGPPPSGRR